MNIEEKLRNLEQQILVLHRENEAVAKLLIEKVKPVVDDFERCRNNDVGVAYS